MESGARFYRCDFQVHTPRDTNWSGDRPTTDADRNKYAAKFIAACRRKGLQAVAITDHHDIVFYPYIREAAKHEVSDNGQPVREDEQIVVFPGMELTLAVPCQALLILDAEFPSNLLSAIPTVLSVTPNDASTAQHAPVVRLDHFESIKALCEHLDTIDYLRGHYIVLPNVGESGNFSILRKGFAAKYKEMPCVGGYVDGSMDKLGDGNRKILRGEAREYGFKKLAVFQTSDNRKDDFSNLGIAASWVKWAIPTAEALRQACLAEATRISNSEPQLPALVIQSVEVSNSKFLGPISLGLNPQLNCLIGGRGTGKSTILEYIRWALCDQPAELPDDSEIPDVQRKRATLIANTLLPLDAVVSISFLLNGIRHVVRRYAKTGQLTMKVGAADYQECHEDTVRDLLAIQAYSQKQLSTVGVRMEELNRFIETPIHKNLRDFELRHGQLRNELRNSYARMQRKRTVAHEMDKERMELSSLSQQVQQLRAQLTGLSEADQKILEQHDAYLEEEQIVSEADRTLSDWRQQLEAVAREINIPTVFAKENDTLPDKALLNQINAEVISLQSVIRQRFSDIEKALVEFGGTQSKLRVLATQVLAKVKIHNEQYESAKQRSSAHQSRLTQITQAEQRMRVLTNSLADKERQIAGLGKPEDEYQISRKQWLELYAERGDALETRCNELTQLSNKRIRARLRRGAGIAQVQLRLIEILSGTRIRTNKVEILCAQVASATDPIAQWSTILEELEKVWQFGTAEGSTSQLVPCPTLKQAGFTDQDLDKLSKEMTAEEWLELSLTELLDLPVFEYQQREEEYIAFADASAGQQATALLRVLLNQDGPPLIIDQPEEDLDNPVILEIVKDIWNAKAKRQLLFSSHNANIVVNGDADLVICCDYRKASDQSGGTIKLKGAIDMDEIRTEITQVMEGGKEAFRLRKEKYGF